MGAQGREKKLKAKHHWTSRESPCCLWDERENRGKEGFKDPHCLQAARVPSMFSIHQAVPMQEGVTQGSARVDKIIAE